MIKASRLISLYLGHPCWHTALMYCLVAIPTSAQEIVGGGQSDVAWAENVAFDIRMGKQYVNAYCSRCHGRDGKGARGPDLTTGNFRHGKTDEELLQVIQEGIPGTDMEGRGKYDDIQLPMIAYLRAAALKPSEHKPPTGDVARGYELFKQNQCGSCHWTGSHGGRQGPDLSRLTAPPNYVRNSMLAPDAQIDLEYQQVKLQLEDEQILSGRRLHENSYFLLVMDAQENLHTIDKRRVQEIKRPHQSLMPSFKEKLSSEDVEDITTYIYSLQLEPPK